MSGGGYSPAIPSTGGGVAQQHSKGGGGSPAIGGGAGLVFANGGGPLKQRKQRGGIDRPTIAVRGLQKSNPDNIDDILQKLTENPSMKKKDTYTPQEQDTILKNLLKHVKSLQNSKSDIYTINVGLVKSTD
jgi:hypothetical protein